MFMTIILVIFLKIRLFDKEIFSDLLNVGFSVWRVSKYVEEIFALILICITFPRVLDMGFFPTDATSQC